MSDFNFSMTDSEFVDMLNIGIDDSKGIKAYVVTRLYVTTIDTHYMPEIDSEKFKTLDEATAEFNRCNHAVITHRHKIVSLKCENPANKYYVSPFGHLVDTRDGKVAQS